MESQYLHSVEELRQWYAPPGERAVRKQLTRLDRHCEAFISRSPFLVLATGSGSAFDASPRGGAPGFVQVADEHTLWIPDAPGNNRLDSLTNIVATGAVGLLFLIPGVDETLRVNGTARLSVDPELLCRVADERRTPKLVIEVTVVEAFLHCAKALMRSQLWSPEVHLERSVLPTMGQMLAEQTGSSDAIETQEAMIARYQKDL